MEYLNRYNLALLMLALVVGPLFYISSWLGALAVVAIYCLIARLASNDLDRHEPRIRRSVALVSKGRADTEYPHAARRSTFLAIKPPPADGIQRSSESPRWSGRRSTTSR